MHGTDHKIFVETAGFGVMASTPLRESRCRGCNQPSDEVLMGGSVMGHVGYWYVNLREGLRRLRDEKQVI